MPELVNLLPLAFLDVGAGLLGVILGVGALIFFHELGHFLAAKWAGVKVEVFSLGFGHRLAGFRWGDTDYRISMLPLGGYVKMLGQADDEAVQAPTDRPDDFRNKPPGKRFVILVAGVVMNLVLAAIGFMAAFGLGVEFTAAEVGLVQAGSAAARADLRPGDLILKIDGEEILGWQDLQTLVAISDGEIELEVMREGAVFTTTARPQRGAEDSYARLGVEPSLVVGALKDDSPLRAAGLVEASTQRSDRLVAVAPVGSDLPARRMPLGELGDAVRAARGPVRLRVERTAYDDHGRPQRTETLELTTEVPQQPDWTLDLDLSPAAYARGVIADGPAARAGVLEGDRIVALGEHEDITQENLKERVQEVGVRQGEEPVRLVVERQVEGRTERHELQVSLGLENGPQLAQALDGVAGEDARREVRREVGRWLLGISYRADVLASDWRPPLLEADAEAVLVPAGSRLTALKLEKGWFFWGRDYPPAGPDVVQELLRERQDRPMRVSWITPDGQEGSAVVAARKHPERTYGDLGFGLVQRHVVIERGPLAAVSLGLHETVIQTQRIFLMVRSFVTGDVSTRELGGPIQIVSVAYTIAQDSFPKLLHLLAILSVNLAVINILPIPVLDGGHILFLAIEKLRGRPVSNEVLEYANYVGLIAILGLMALVFFNDIRRMVSG